MFFLYLAKINCEYNDYLLFEEESLNHFIQVHFKKMTDFVICPQYGDHVAHMYLNYQNHREKGSIHGIR